MLSRVGVRGLVGGEGRMSWVAASHQGERGRGWWSVGCWGVGSAALLLLASVSGTIAFWLECFPCGVSLGTFTEE